MFEERSELYRKNNICILFILSYWLNIIIHELILIFIDLVKYLLNGKHTIKFVYVNHIISNMHVMCNVRKTIEMEDSLLCHSRIKTNNLTDSIQIFIEYYKIKFKKRRVYVEIKRSVDFSNPLSETNCCSRRKEIKRRETHLFNNKNDYNFYNNIRDGCVFAPFGNPSQSTFCVVFSLSHSRHLINLYGETEITEYRRPSRQWNNNHVHHD
ncbi:hypothetical protein AGLY_005752 [Aphis glycines]|uniref:Uncharacterized protein n=1 Tax=Aphis glycines TaxID=307491 RepID=A0A6G0TW07_APHGL|nr:hypothetical protein AGLY_005752 [Aphis glycines]